jgi:hypothetical protein
MHRLTVNLKNCYPFIMNRKAIFPVIAFFLLFASNTYADVVWPGLYLAGRMLWWAIPAGILIEVFIVKSIIIKSWPYALWVTAVVNIISTIIGALGALLGNLAFEATMGLILYKYFQVGTFNALSWSSAIIFGALVSTIIEVYSLKTIFKIKLNSRQRYIFLGANLLSTLVAFASILLKRPFY